jgi:hypothetical protein
VPIQKLTKRVVDAITSGDKTVIYYDSELTGFCLKVLASGGNDGAWSTAAGPVDGASARPAWF